MVLKERTTKVKHNSYCIAFLKFILTLRATCFDSYRIIFRPSSYRSRHTNFYCIVESPSLTEWCFIYIYICVCVCVCVCFIYIVMYPFYSVVTAVAQWLRCCATNRKVAGSIPAGVTGIFYWHKILPIALWFWGRLSLKQKWVPGVFPGGKCGWCVRLTTLPPSCAVVMKSGNLNFLEPSGPLQACNGTALPLPLLSILYALEIPQFSKRLYVSIYNLKAWRWLDGSRNMWRVMLEYILRMLWISCCIWILWSFPLVRFLPCSALWLYQDANKSLARPGRKQVRKDVRDARDFNNIETRALIKFFFSCKVRRRRKFTPFWLKH